MASAVDGWGGGGGWVWGMARVAAAGIGVEAAAWSRVLICFGDGLQPVQIRFVL